MTPAYEIARANGSAAAAAGDFARACDEFGAALGEARSAGDAALVDRALVNKAYALIELREFRAPEVTSLPSLLMRTADAPTARLAAYHLARSFELQGDYEKAERYNRSALAKSRELGNAAWIASSYNRLGDLYLYKSRFQEAAACYREALALAGEYESDPLRRAIIEDNLGYALMLQKQVEAGIALSLGALQCMEKLGARGHSLYPRIDLAYGYLEIGETTVAIEHGEQALALGEEFANASVVKNACYLLGESHALAGDEEEADRYFDRLARHYPELRYVKQILHAVDLRSLINLRL